jgi:hypothetical protein
MKAALEKKNFIPVPLGLVPVTGLLALLQIVCGSYLMAAQNDGAPTPSVSGVVPSTVRKQIFGVVKSGSVPLPGVSISSVNTTTGRQIITSSDTDGSYSLLVPDNGQYDVNAELSAFAPTKQQITIDDNHASVRADLQLILQSRVQTPATGSQGAEARRQNGEGVRTSPDRFPGRQSAEGQVPGRQFPNRQGQGRVAGNNAPGFMNLPALEQQTGGEASESDTQSQESSNGATPSDVTPESVTVSGAAPRMDQANLGEMRDLLYQGGGQGPGQPGAPGGGPGGFGPGGFGPGGPGGFAVRGGPPGGGGGGPFIGGPFGGGRGRRNANRIRGNISYTFGDSAFDAKPYSLNGLNQTKPQYIQNRYSISLGGPLNIPKIYHGGSSTFFFVSYDGNHSQNPYDMFSTVPTVEERLGNFSDTTVRRGANAGLPVQIFDPRTGLPFNSNVIPPGQIDPVAKSLLTYIPLPNLPGETENFHFVTSADNNLNNLNLRLIHTFGGGGPAGRGGGPFGGGGGRGGGNNGRSFSSINFGLNFRSGSNDITNPFPSVGGTTSTRALNVPVGYTIGKGHFVNNIRFNFNRSRTTTQNLYAFSQNIAGQFGIAGVSQNPFDWGLPNLSFTNFGSLRDTNPQLRRDQTYSFSDYVTWSHGRHTVHLGGDFRRIQQNPETDANARGTFIFTGFNTAASANGIPVPGTGYDFADFLLGLPQQTSAQFGTTSYYFRANSWDLYVQDEWRLRANLTLNFGLRYEYVSPFTEKYNRIVNLDAAAGFVAVVPVLAGQSGAFTGSFPSTLMNPDRNNFAPRLGIAWKPLGNTVVRAGYGINYNTGAYSNIVQNLAFQPPFAFTATNVEAASVPLSLENGFPATTAAVTNNFGVDRNYRLGYVQMWNVNIQQQLPWGVLLNVDYTGTKGSHLDMLRAPNRGPTGVLIPGVQPFLWESSEGNSIMHAGTIRVRRRLRQGFQVGGTYVFSKSIDNASSIGGAGNVVAQNDFDLSAERGLSSFDQRHRFSADYLWELPLGPDKRWLRGKGALPQLLSGWQLSGTINIASGVPFTARILGNFTDVSRGTNGTLRADATGLPVSIANPTASLFFNTAAFALPAAGQFGDAARNTIGGPPTLSFNMAINKVIPLGENRTLELRAQVNNVFNTPQFQTIDTTVNSPTFGQVLSVGSMRRIQIVARFRF